jgi:hypothetical protein
VSLASSRLGEAQRTQGPGLRITSKNAPVEGQARHVVCCASDGRYYAIRKRSPRGLEDDR